MGKGRGGRLNRLTEIFCDNSTEKCRLKNIVFYSVDNIKSLTLNGGGRPIQTDLFYLCPDRDYDFRFKKGDKVDIMLRNRNSERDWSELSELLNLFDRFKVDRYRNDSTPKEVYIQEVERGGN